MLCRRPLTVALLLASLCIPALAAAEKASAPPWKKVTFTTDDNLVIAGRYLAPPANPSRAPIVILLHMYKSDSSAFDPLAPQLHAAGFAVLAIDLRGHGGSVGPPEMKLAERVNQKDRKLFGAMDKDVEAGYLWLLEQPQVDPARVAIVGASVGSSVALDYSARDRSVDAVVCLTPGTDYVGIDAGACIEKYGSRPLLLMASEPEKGSAERLVGLCPEAKLKVYPSGGSDRMALHGTRLLGRGLGVEKDIVTFLAQAVGASSKEPVVASLKGQVYYAPEAGMASHLSKRNVRWFSSAAEAEKRGLRAPKTRSKTASARGGRGANSPAVGEVESFPEDP